MILIQMMINWIQELVNVKNLFMDIMGSLDLISLTYCIVGVEACSVLSHMSFQKRIVAMTRLHETSLSNTALRHPTKYKLITTFSLFILYILYIYMPAIDADKPSMFVSARRKSNGIAEPNTSQTKSTNSEICKQFIAIS